MKRLLLVPVVVCPVAAAAWFSGLAWPLITQVGLYCKRRPATAVTECDSI